MQISAPLQCDQWSDEAKGCPRTQCQIQGSPLHATCHPGDKEQRVPLGVCKYMCGTRVVAPGRGSQKRHRVPGSHTFTGMRAHPTGPIIPKTSHALLQSLGPHCAYPPILFSVAFLRKLPHMGMSAYTLRMQTSPNLPSLRMRSN